jgi:hypothetical protein
MGKRIVHCGVFLPMIADRYSAGAFKGTGPLDMAQDLLLLLLQKPQIGLGQVPFRGGDFRRA